MKPVEPVQFNLLPEIQAAVPLGPTAPMKGKESVSLTSLTVSVDQPRPLPPRERATLTEGFEPLFTAIAKTHHREPGPDRHRPRRRHTDSSPLQASNPFSTNQRLSEARAETVADILVAAGVPKDRIKVQGKPASQPVADKQDEAGQGRQPRIEILIEKRL